jgi:type II secretory pathway pseudopilin PulG
VTLRVQRVLRCGSEGFSLAEVAVATAMLAMAVVALVELFGIAAVSNRRAHDATYAAVLAGQKMEQLRVLAYAFDSAGVAVTDSTTDTAVVPAVPDGGTGLSASPPDALTRNSAGFVDYLNASGASLGGGADALTGTVYIRRWSIEPGTSNPGNLLLVQVRVVPLHAGRAAGAGRAPDEARVVGVRARKGR